MSRTRKVKRTRKSEDENLIEEEFRFKPEHLKRVPREKRHSPTLEEITNPQSTKVRITMYVDLDILNFFKQSAASKDAAPYQTQINNALRQFINGQTQKKEALLEDEDFISRLAEKVALFQATMQEHIRTR